MRLLALVCGLALAAFNARAAVARWVGSWLHPNDAGYRVMGDAVHLALFR